jgi:Phosphoglycerol transferase and related proteins, alkaline phosphatase superfamily
MDENNKFEIKLIWKKINRIPIYLMFIYFMFVVAVCIKRDSVQDFHKPFLYFFILIWIVLTLLALLEVNKIRSFFKKHAKVLGAITLVLAPVASFLTVEIMVGNFNIEMFKSYTLYNLVWYIIIYYLIFAAVREFKITILLCNGAIYLASMINYFVFLFRGNPIIPSDLLAWQTGMSVASNYTIHFTQGYLIATLIMFTVFVLGFKLEKAEKKPSILNRVIIIASYAVFTVYVFHIFFDTDLIKSKISVIDFFAPKYTYCSYGTAFGFVANVEAMSTKEPEGYSSQKVQEILKPVSKQESNTADTKDKPNIIVIMNEAFSDLSLIGDFKTNMDYLPNIRALKKNTIKGSLFVSVFGGATSDTEYEVLTGNSMAVMPQNSVPYQQFVTRPTDSLARTLKAQGYYNIAIHPYIASDYKRDMVYPLLGFDEFLSMENFKNPTLIRSFISDRDSYKKIIEEYEKKGKDKPLFVFNVTMQNHGGYSGEQLFDDNNTVSLTEHPEFTTTSQYLSLVRESDKAFQTLIDYFSKQDKHTIILLYGDHQPIAYSEIYNLLASEGNLPNAEEMLRKYQVPFILWANYDIPKEDVSKMSANYLSSFLLKTAGLKGTVYNQYLDQLFQKVPVINALYYIDKDNIMHTYSEASLYNKLIQDYRYVGYNDAFDKKGKLKEYFNLSPVGK